MRKIVSLLACIWLCSFNTFAQDTAKITTPEYLGNHLFEILINRGDIAQSPFAVDIDKLFPEQDFDEFNDSPAELVLTLLTGLQLQLPDAWNKILHTADSIALNKNATYIKTYFIPSYHQQYKLFTIIQSHLGSNYALIADIMQWNDNNTYITRVYELLQYNGDLNALIDKSLRMMEEEEDFFKDERPEVIPYKYDTSFTPSAYNETRIASYNLFVEKITNAITTHIAFEDLDFALSLEEYREMFSDTIMKEAERLMNKADSDSIKMSYREILSNRDKTYESYIKGFWNELVDTLKQFQSFEIISTETELSNIPFWGKESYNITTTFTLKSPSTNYIFFCRAILVNDRWKLAFTTRLEEVQPQYLF